MRKILYLAALTLACSCSKEKEINNLNGPDKIGSVEKYIPVLKKMGYSTKDIKDYDNWLVVEGTYELVKTT
ncbi:MAG: hypothetical protein WAQ28_20355 [Bacteroidia bacterium]